MIADRAKKSYSRGSFGRVGRVTGNKNFFFFGLSGERLQDHWSSGFIVQLSLSLRTKILCISGVPMNDLAPMKNCPGGVQGRSN